MYKRNEENKIPEASVKKESVPETIPTKKEAVVTKEDTNSGNYILKLEGLITQVQKELEKIPAGDIPVKVLHEAADVHTFGKQSYIFFMEKSKNANEKVLLIDAVGLEDLARKVTDIYGKYRLIDVVSQPVNKRLQSKKIYLAIFVG